jgi:hypothetical protein
VVSLSNHKKILLQEAPLYGKICEGEAFVARMTIDVVWEMIFYVRRQGEYLFGNCELGFIGAENL